MAMAGGTGSYFPAYSPVDLTTTCRPSTRRSWPRTAATSASAINSTGISTTSVAYQGTFTTSDVYEDWTGNLLAYPINAATGYINTAYSAAQLAGAVAARRPELVQPRPSDHDWDPVTSQGHPLPLGSEYHGDPGHRELHAAWTGARNLRGGYQRPGRARVPARQRRQGAADGRSLPQSHATSSATSSTAHRCTLARPIGPWQGELIHQL